MNLVAIILTKNEERHIADCIASVAWADQVLVSDSFSEDATVALAQAAGAVVSQRAFQGWAVQRNSALDEAAKSDVSRSPKRLRPQISSRREMACSAPRERSSHGAATVLGAWAVATRRY